MKKFTSLILLLCLFSGSCNILKKTKESVDITLVSYYTYQNYTFTVSKNKTYVKASVYYSPSIGNNPSKFVSKIDINGIEMNKGLLKTEPDYTSQCLDSVKKDDSSQIDKPELIIIPNAEKTPEPEPQESDFYIVLDGFNTLNKITITNQENKTETYIIRTDPLRLKDPESIKISRTKDNIIQLKGRSRKKKEDLNYFISQRNVNFLDDKTLQFNPVDSTIKIPANLSKKFNKGTAIFHLSSYIYDEIPTPGLASGNNFSVYFTDEFCIEIID